MADTPLAGILSECAGLIRKINTDAARPIVEVTLYHGCGKPELCCSVHGQDHGYEYVWTPRCYLARGHVGRCRFR